MSELLLVCASGLVIGVLAGAVVGVSGYRWWLRRHPAAPIELLTEVDRTAIEAEFAAHASAVVRQVSEFADALADGDVVLRERLRRLERAEAVV